MSSSTSKIIASHFPSAEKKIESCKLGMWLFLLTEIMLFGTVITCFFIYKHIYYDSFSACQVFLDVKFGAVNTVILLFSSLTVALSIHYVQHKNKTLALLTLFTTILCASVFLCIKYVEYSHKIHLGLLPGQYFDNESVIKNTANPGLFFSLYYILTGLHGFHVIIGMIVLSVFFFRIISGNISHDHTLALELGGLYWHLVDIIWIFLFPLLYLLK